MSLLGMALRHERRKRGWTLTQASKAVGVTWQYCWKLESGMRRPSHGTLHKFIRVYGDDAAEPLLVAAGYMTPREPVVEDELRALDEAMRGWSDERQRAARRVLRALRRSA